MNDIEFMVGNIKQETTNTESSAEGGQDTTVTNCVNDFILDYINRSLKVRNDCKLISLI